jgi:Transmembrane domain of unknown function (DUF3566)
MTDTHAATASAETAKATVSADGKAEASERAGGAEAAVSGAGTGASAGSSGSSSNSSAAGGDSKAAGRATVPTDGARSAASGSGSDGGPKFVRAPGMVPPPDSLTVPVQTPAAAKGTATVSSPAVPLGGVPAGMPAEAPSSGPPAVARASVRIPGNTVGAATSPSTTGVLGLRGTRPEDSATPGVTTTGSARVTEAVRAARKTVTAAASRGPRRARLHLKRIDPWSVMKFSFAVSFVLFVVVIVATSVLYLALDAMGVFESVNKTLSQLIGATGSDNSGSGFRITAKGVIGGAALLGLVNVVLFTALATLGAFIYNVCADLVGGIELTLAEKE